jgi:glycosyltransferase involved in cell wall biosynthesis
MKIALIAPIEETVPPTKYGGIEWVIANIAEYLGKKGHTVHVFAPGNSQKNSSYEIIPLVDLALRNTPSLFNDNQLKETLKLLAAAKAAELINQGEYDIVNNHAWWHFLLYAPFIKQKVITTHHMPLSINFQNEVLLAYKHLPHIALSNNQKKELPDLNFVATIMNGIRIQSLPTPLFTANKLPYDMFFLGRINPDKGLIEAVKTARLTKKKLIVAAKKMDENYFKEFMSYVDNKNVIYLGELTHEEAMKYLSLSKMLIMPVTYEDPCPLVPLESLACATPVISYARGALPEQIEDGQTGYLINESEIMNRGNWIVHKNGIEGLCEAVNIVTSMPEKKYFELRKKCRSTAERRFSMEHMASQYESLFTSFS